MSTHTPAAVTQVGWGVGAPSTSMSVSPHPVHQVSPVRMLSTATYVSVQKDSQVWIVVRGKLETVLIESVFCVTAGLDVDLSMTRDYV